MKHKYLLLLVLISSLFGFLQWGGGQQMFLLQMEADIFKKMFVDPISVIHPFVVLPLLGQLLLMIAILKKRLSMKLIYTGVSCIGVLFAMILFVGLISMNIKVIASTLPFFSFTAWLIYAIKQYRQSIAK